MRRQYIKVLFLAAVAVPLVFTAVRSAPGASADKPGADRSVAPIPKEEKQPTLGAATRSWLEDLRKRVRRAEAKHNQIVAVAAVRGDEITDPPPLYWKGRRRERPVTIEELTALNGAVSSALDGSRAASLSALHQFIEEYPDSPLIGDAREALEMLASELSP